MSDKKTTIINCAAVINTWTAVACTYAANNVCDYLVVDVNTLEALGISYTLKRGIWRGQILTDTDACAYRGYDIYIDTKMNTARAFAVMAQIFAGFAFLGSLASLAPKARSQELLGTLALLALITCFSEGLTLLLLSSSACDNILGLGEITGVTCSLGTGAKLAIASVVLWFVAPLATAATMKSMGAPSAPGESVVKEVAKEPEIGVNAEEPPELAHPADENA